MGYLMKEWFKKITGIKKIEEEKMAIFEEYISSLMSKNNII